MLELRSGKARGRKQVAAVRSAKENTPGHLRFGTHLDPTPDKIISTRYATMNSGTYYFLYPFAFCETDRIRAIYSSLLVRFMCLTRLKTVKSKVTRKVYARAQTHGSC